MITKNNHFFREAQRLYKEVNPPRETQVNSCLANFFNVIKSKIQQDKEVKKVVFDQIREGSIEFEALEELIKNGFKAEFNRINDRCKVYKVIVSGWADYNQE